jgi:septum formation protein
MENPMSQIILASASPRRRELLEQIGLEFDVCPAKGEEIITKSKPEEVVMELAHAKAVEVASMVDTYAKNHAELSENDILVIGADTVVSCVDKDSPSDNIILGKPKDEADAARMLRMLSGATHSVYTGVSIVFMRPEAAGEAGAGYRAGEHLFYDKTDVTMAAMSDDEIRRYIATGEPMDKAGAYGIQGKCAIYVEKIDGDYHNVVGLPVAAIYREMKKLGVDIYSFCRG